MDSPGDSCQSNGAFPAQRRDLRGIMILHFPDLQAVRLALTSGAVAPAVSRAAARAGFAEESEEIWIETAVDLPREGHAALRALGVRGCRSAPRELDLQVGCWPQLLPLEPAPRAENWDDSTPVIFELNEASQFPELVSEMLRLGNDRQTFRQIGRGSTLRTLLRVIGPPYYTLLRALERDGGVGALRAYVERAPRVWVEMGYTHPLMSSLRTPANKLLLIATPRDWTMIGDAPFHDVHQVVEFALPESAETWDDVAQPPRFPVSLRLVRGEPADVPELWVLHDNPLSQVDALVQGAGERLVSQLAFAVVERDTQTLVVLRTRPGKGGAPILVLDGLALRPWLKLPNLFIPCGSRLHPPLRREAIKTLLASDLDRITWLEPRDSHGFVPCSISDSAFRPLEDWVEYVLDRDRQALHAWMQAAQFEFAPFVCRETTRSQRPDVAPQPPRPAKEKSGERPPAGPEQDPGLMERMLKKLRPASTATPADADAAPAAPDSSAGRKTAETPAGAAQEAQSESADHPAHDAATVPPDLLSPAERKTQQLRLQELEAEFFQSEAAPDPEARRALWPRIARMNASLGYFNDAALCWKQALWDETSPEDRWWQGWFQAECREARPPLSAEQLDAILTDPEPGTSPLNELAAHVSWAAHVDSGSAAVHPTSSSKPASGMGPDQARAVVERLGHVQHLLEKHEESLSVRTAWLAWCAVVRLSHGDSLALARARDRILERLLQQGLNPALELPGFLRTADVRSGKRFRMVRDQLVHLHDRVRKWSADRRGLSAKTTREYIDLTFAYGLARLVETDNARRLLDRASVELPGNDSVHAWLVQAYTHRISSSIDGQTGPLPAELMDALEQLPREPRYKVDRLREHSRILEPHEKVKPYAHWQRFRDPLSQKLVNLFDLFDRPRLALELRALLNPTEAETPQRMARVLTASLELAPRLGESFALEVLPRVLPLLDELTDVVQQAQLLERGLFLAAHFDQSSLVQAFVGRFQQLLEAPIKLDTLKSLEPALHQSFKGLRTLGMREEIAWLFQQMGEAVGRAEPETPSSGQTAPAAGRPETLKLLLQVSAGWLYFGEADRAWPILDEARALLFAGTLKPFQQTPLACAYVTALGHAPLDSFFERIDELFEKLGGISDTYTTNSHYALSQLDVVEAVVLALVSDDLILDAASRRWLEDDEFLIRRRIHRDVRSLTDTTTH